MPLSEDVQFQYAPVREHLQNLILKMELVREPDSQLASILKPPGLVVSD